MKGKLVFKNYAEMRKFYKGGGKYEEPKRVAKVEAVKKAIEARVKAAEEEGKKDAVPAKRSNKKQSKGDAGKKQ